MIRTAEQLAKLPPPGDGEHKCVSIRSALPGSGGDIKFLDHLQKKYSHQLGFLPRQALEWNIANGKVSIALENDEPAAYLLGKGNYLRDPVFGIIYQAAVSYDARRRLMGTALVQHFMDHMAPGIRLIGLWCAQDIEANEFWNACGFEAIAARHGSRRRGRVHIFWVGKTPMGKNEQLRYPKYTKGGLMREHREVYGIAPGSEYKEVVLPERANVETSGHPALGYCAAQRQNVEKSKRRNGAEARAARPRAESRPGNSPTAAGGSLADMQRAFRYGQGNHICVVIAGATKYLPVAPFEMPNFTDLARTMVSSAGAAEPAIGGKGGQGSQRIARPAAELWTPAA